MLFKPARGQESPPRLSNNFGHDPIRPDEARFAAWANALGQATPARRRPHRGILPDVDFSRAEPAPKRPGVVLLLWRWLARKRRPNDPTPATVLSGGNVRPIGNSVQAPYLEWTARDWEPAAPDTPYGPSSQRPAA